MREVVLSNLRCGWQSRVAESSGSLRFNFRVWILHVVVVAVWTAVGRLLLLRVSRLLRGVDDFDGHQLVVVGVRVAVDLRVAVRDLFK